MSEAAARPSFDLPAWGLTALAFGLVFVGLGDRTFWQDEAETAKLALNALTFGLPYAFDGLNLVSQEQQTEFGPDFLWRWSPWAQIYVSALSMKLFGVSALGGRTLFALIGALTVPLTVQLAKRETGDRSVALVSGLCLVLSVPFLLFVGQNRYYPLGMALLVGALWFLPLFEEPKRPKIAAGIAALLLGLMFHVNYLLFFSCAPAVLLARILVRRRFPALGPSLVASAAILVCVVPGFSLYGLGRQGGMLDFTTIPHGLAVYFASLTQFMIPLPTLAAFVWLFRRFLLRFDAANLGRSERFTLFCLLVTVLNCGAMSLVPQVFFRYIVHLYPLVAVALGYGVVMLRRVNRPAGLVYGVLLLGTNWLHMVPMDALKMTKKHWLADETMLTAPNIPLALYVKERIGGYPDVNNRLVDYFKRAMRPEETAMVTYGDLPLMIFVPGRFIGGLADTPPAPGEEPDFVVKRSASRIGRHGGLIKSDLWWFTQFNASRYEAVELPGEDERFGARPDPYYHRFVPPRRPHLPLVVYKKRGDAP